MHGGSKRFQRGLKDLGYVEGKNIVSEYRYTEGETDQDARLLAELIASNVNLIVTGRTETVLRAKKATHTIPIVFVGIGDPVGNQLVASLAHPGGNLTGLSECPQLVASVWSFSRRLSPGFPALQCSYGNRRVEGRKFKSKSWSMLRRHWVSRCSIWRYKGRAPMRWRTH